MQDLQVQTFFIFIQGRGKVIDRINNIELRGCARETSYCLKYVMYKNSHEVRIVAWVEERKLMWEIDSRIAK